MLYIGELFLAEGLRVFFFFFSFFSFFFLFFSFFFFFFFFFFLSFSFPAKGRRGFPFPTYLFSFTRVIIGNSNNLGCRHLEGVWSLTLFLSLTTAGCGDGAGCFVRPENDPICWRFQKARTDLTSWSGCWTLVCRVGSDHCLICTLASRTKIGAPPRISILNLLLFAYPTRAHSWLT